MGQSRLVVQLMPEPCDWLMWSGPFFLAACRRSRILLLRALVLSDMVRGV